MGLFGFQLEDVDAVMVELDLDYIFSGRSVTVQEECTVVPGSPIASLEYRVIEGNLGDRPEIMVTCDGTSQARVSGVEWRGGYGAATISFDPPLEPDEETVVNCQYLAVTPHQPVFLRRHVGAADVVMVSMSVYFDDEQPPATCWRTEWSADVPDAAVVSEREEYIHRTPTDIPGQTLRNVGMSLTEVAANKTVGFRWE